MPSTLPDFLPPDPGIGGLIDDPTAGPHKGGGGGGPGPYDPSFGLGMAGGGGFGFNQTYNPFLGFGPQQRIRSAMYAQQQQPFAMAQSPQYSPSPSMSAARAPTPSSGGFSSLGDLIGIAHGNGGSFAGFNVPPAAQRQTPANDVDLLLAALGQGPWSIQGDPAERATLTANAQRRALAMQQSALLGSQIDTQDPWLRAFASTQGRLNGQRAAADELSSFDTNQANFLRDLRAQLLMAKLGQYYNRQDQPKQGFDWGALLGKLGAAGIGALFPPAKAAG